MAESVRALIKTVPERCRVCYTCVRECPAKAIRITKGQAEVIADRCICCGNCVRVCSQRAKEVVDDVPAVAALLASDARVAALVAPSFPAEFADFPHSRLVGMVRALGFDLVVEVGFGADLVARAYDHLLREAPQRRFIETTCPAIVSYVEHYHPPTVDHLAPLVSPMIAAARAVRVLYGQDVKTVFLGPCIAKKGEASEPQPNADRDVRLGEVEAVLTFHELQRLFAQHDFEADNVPESEFDPPWSGLGALFPLSRGLLQAARISEDLVSGDIVSADGRTGFVEAIKEFESGDLDARLLQVLCCEGCIMGPGMSGLDVLEALQGGDHDQLVVMITAYATIETAITATKRGAFDVLPKPFDPQELKAVVRKAASNLMARRKAAELQRDKDRIRFQFISVLAHELKAPLAALDGYLFILRDRPLGDDVAAYERIVYRCLLRTEGMRKLILDLLDLTRLESEQNRREREPVDVAAVAERAVETVQPLADERGIKVTVRADGDLVVTADAGEIEIVLNNLISNAVKYNRDGGRVDVLLGAADGVVTLRVEDTGIGMTPTERKRLFAEFVRIKNDHTKNIMGSGLGLSIVKRIVERYDGEVAVESTPDVGSAFTVKLRSRL